MPQNNNGLVLEILKQKDSLKMSVFAQSEIVSTLRHYSLCSINWREIGKLCRETVFLLSKADKEGLRESFSINDLRKTGQLLWDHLFTGPVKEKLKNAQSRDLVLSLDEELVGIPWEILYDGRDFLCLKFNLGRLIRTGEQKDLMRYRSLGGKLRMLILANPTNDLKSAYFEGTYIKNQFDARRKDIGIDFKSTDISTLYVKKNLRDYDIVHFAGHCEHDPDNPDNTGWVLSDGKLNMRDIHIMAQSQNLPTLIFSNACLSAKVAKGITDKDCQEKTYSLASAFLFSGVRHYIGTIRRTEDPASLVFAKEFYTQLIYGKSVGESLRLGRIRLIKEYGADSVSWAGYLLYGDPNFVFFRQKIQPPALPIKKSFLSYTRPAFWISYALAIMSICVFLYMWLPTVNPRTYALFIKARSLFQQGKNQETILSCANIIEKDRLFLAVYPLIADTYQRLGDRDSALKYYFEYALLSEKRMDKSNLASAYTGIGWIYYLHAQYAAAADFYNKAINLSVEIKDKLNEARALRKLAVWHIYKDENERALELLMKSSEIDRERQYIYEHKYNLACDYFDIGLVFVNKHDYPAAKDFYSKSRALFEKLNLIDELSDCYFNLGEIFLFEKQYQKAQDYYLKGMEIDRANQDKFKLASDYNMFGELYLAMDNIPDAERFFNMAASISKETDNPVELALAYNNLGLICKQKGQKSKARQYLRQAQEIYRLIDIKRYQQIKQEFLTLDS